MMFSALACADQSTLDGTHITYEKKTLSDDEMDTRAVAELNVSNKFETLVSLKSNLTPGCSKIPAISTIMINGKALPMTCGSNGGRTETITVVGSINGNKAVATLGFGQMVAEVHEVQGTNYFLTAQPSFDTNQSLVFKVYTLFGDLSSIGFAPAETGPAVEIYLSALSNYKDVGGLTNRTAAEVSSLLEHTKTDKPKTCSILKALNSEPKNQLDPAVSEHLLAQQKTICEGK